jgi:hypothetical protein
MTYGERLATLPKDGRQEPFSARQPLEATVFVA